MAQKFLTDIEVTQGLVDSSGDLGVAGQVLSSTGTATNWITNEANSTVVYQDGFTGDNSTVDFTLSVSVTDENITQVYLDGVYQHKDTYSVSNTTLTFSTAPPLNADIEVITFSTATTSDDLQAGVVIIPVKNTHTASIAKGEPVYITGNVGSSARLQIAPADASNSAKMPAAGLLLQTLAVNAEGYVVTGGYLRNITTDTIDGTSTSSNDTVYVKAGGGLTMTKPTGNNLIQNIAKVARSASGSAGSLLVSSILRTNDVPNEIDRNINFSDNSKLTFGNIASPDLEIYHDGSTSYINETGTGDLALNTNGASIKLLYNSTEFMGQFVANGAARLYYDNSLKLATTSTGVSVTGTAKNNGIEVESAVPTILFDETDVTANWRNRVQAGTYKVQYASNGSTFSDILNITSTGINVTGNLSVSGDLTIDGTTTTLNTQTVEVEDNILQLNTTQGSPDTATATTSGISVYRGNGVTQASFIFDDADDTWDLTDNLFVAGNISTTSGNLSINGTGFFASTLTVRTANSNILTLDRTTSAGGYMRFQNNGTDKFYIGSRGTISGSGGTGYDIYAVGGNDIRFFPGTLLALTLDTSANATFAGNVTINKAANPTKLQIGSSLADDPFIHFQTDGENYSVGVDRSDSNKFKISNGNTVATNTRVTMDTSGNVGIGTTSPTSKIHSVITTAGDSALKLQDDTGSVFDFQCGISGVTGDALLIKDTTLSYDYFTLRGGNVIIGNTNVDNPNSLDKVLEIEHGGSVGLILNDSRDNPIGLENRGAVFHLTHNTNSRLVVDGASGNVGIGTTSPRSITNHTSLTINGTSVGRVDLAYGGTISASLYSNNSATGLQTESALPLVFSTNSTERMRITSGGKVGIGTQNSQNAELAIKSGSNFDLELYSESGGTAWQSYNRTTSSWGYLRFIAGGGEQMRIHTNGNVGIGVTNPQPKLHLQYAGGSYGSDSTSGFINEATTGRGTMRIRSATDNPAELFFDVNGAIRWDISCRNGAAPNLQFYPQAATPAINAVSAHTFELQQDGDVIVTGGRLGIGTTAPDQKLHVVGKIYSTDRTQSANTLIGSQTISSTNFATLGSNSSGVGIAIARDHAPSSYPDIIINSSGNIGMGTASPGGKLEINAQGGGIGGYTGFKMKYGTSSVQSLYMGQVTAGNGAFIGTAQYRNAGYWQTEGTASSVINMQSDGVIAFYTNSGLTANTDFNISERMRITSSGDVLLGGHAANGSINPVLNGYGFQANGLATGVCNFSGTNEMFVLNQRDGTGTTQLEFRNGNVERGRIEWTTSATTYNTISDYRLKENINNLTDSLLKINQLQPKSFNFISNPNELRIGFIAHEVQEIVPQAVTGTKDEIREDGAAKYQGLDNSMLVPLLVGAIKELKAEVETLKNQINGIN